MMAGVSALPSASVIARSFSNRLEKDRASTVADAHASAKDRAAAAIGP